MTLSKRTNEWPHRKIRIVDENKKPPQKKDHEINYKILPFALIGIAGFLLLIAFVVTELDTNLTNSSHAKDLANALKNACSLTCTDRGTCIKEGEIFLKFLQLFYRLLKFYYFQK